MANPTGIKRRQFRPDAALLHHTLAEIARRSNRNLGPHMIGAAMRQAVAENA